MFGEKKNVIATYSKKRPVQYTKAIHFLTPDTLEDPWKPYSDDKSLNQVATNTKGSKSWITPSRSQGSALALRNISNIPLEKTLSRTSCARSQEENQRKTKSVVSFDSLPHELSCKAGKQHKPSSVRLTKRRSRSRKSKVLMSKTTYSSKSMSSCSVCINPAYNTNQVYSSLKSMSLCKSTPNDDIPDVSTDEMPESKSLKTSKPSNSTFLDEHLNVEFKDIIFEDLSPITEDPRTPGKEQMTPSKKDQLEPDLKELHKREVSGVQVLPRCSTPVDSGKLHIETQPNVSPIDASCQSLVSLKPMSSAGKVKESPEEVIPNITPETVYKKECIATEEPKQKRKLAYSMDVNNIPECILLHAVNNEKHPYKLMFKQNVFSCDDHRPSLPVDILIESS